MLPSDGGEPLLPGMTGGPGGPQHAHPTPPPAPAAPPGGQAWNGAWGPEQHQPPAAPPPGQGWTPAPAQPWAGPEQPAVAWGTPDNAPAPSQPLPPENAPAPSYGSPAYGGQDYGTPSQGYGPQGTGALPPAAPYGDDGATQFIPPVADGATQYIPPVVGDAATQYIPPVGGGALPPEVTPEAPAESTQVLGRVRQNPAPNPDAEATQYIAPVPASAGGERQTPAEFDNLFRSEPGGEPPAASTQQLPRFQQPQPQPYGAQQPSFIPRRERHDDEEPRRGGRTGSRVTLFAAVGVAIAVLGVGAGALMASGGEDDKSDNKTVAATAPASQSASPSPSADPAEQQAVELDKLLADSGNSRTMVINAVADVKACTNLSQAAKDLRDAAKQRNDLVTKLSTLAVDKLPQHTELTTALNKAWQASASADNHYAAWADQVAQRKGSLCKKGQAKSTPQTQAGNQASGTASTEKIKASGLWNSIAKTYGLTERQPTQL
ncbi:hypothetical protein H4N64_24050 [Streptomyces sp. PSKA01]|uniref:Uncharacterized protein n=1 Tax=Streptomyces cupreus TaxID=2759956 RepID=A0A7X1J6R6_9ACTN|nr:hypothetical protein [Streptomyces cupreus]